VAGIESNRFGFSGKRSTRKMYHLEIFLRECKIEFYTVCIYTDREREIGRERERGRCLEMMEDE